MMPTEQLVPDRTDSGADGKSVLGGQPHQVAAGILGKRDQAS